MTKSLFMKIFLTYSLIFCTVFALIIPFSFKIIREQYTDTLKKELEKFIGVIAPTVATLMETKDNEKLDSYIESIKNVTANRITIIDPDGTVISDSHEDKKIMENHRIRPEVISALNGEFGSSVRVSETTKEEMLYVAVPVKIDGQIIGVIRMSVFMRDVNDLLFKLEKRVAYVAVAFLLIGMGIALFFSWTISEPIKELGDAARRVATGDFGARVFLKGEGEVKDLSNAFNAMAERIETQVDELSRKNEELMHIISSMEDGIVVLDPRGIILLFNKALKKTIHSEILGGEYYWKTIREARFGELMHEIQSGKSLVVTDVTINRRRYVITGRFFENEGRIIVVWRDVTEMENLERIKKEFIANLSHELNTPLTAIKGFLETFEVMDGDKKDHYLEIIKRNTDRMIAIVKDISLLSELDERKRTFIRERIDLTEIIRGAVAIFEKEAMNKGISLSLQKIKGTDIHIMGDPFKLEQAFINLIDNAIKYTEKGKITLVLAPLRDHVEFTIEDTGIGIPEKDIPRIFERFYRADKSRSRKLGGTGLGLSIVKNIIHGHNGRLSVESAPGKGTKITVLLPIK